MTQNQEKVNKARIKYLLLNLVGIFGILLIGFIGNKYPGWAGTTGGSFVGWFGIVIFGFPIFYAWRKYG